MAGEIQGAATGAASTANTAALSTGDAEELNKMVMNFTEKLADSVFTSLFSSLLADGGE